MTQESFGIYIGSTVHEVAQVVAAGRAISDDTGNAAVIAKMIRVMMLAPFLLILSSALSRGAGNASGKKPRSPFRGSRLSLFWSPALTPLICCPARWCTR